MATWREQAGIVQDPNEVLVGIELWSHNELTRDSINSHRIRAGIANGDRVDWVGTLDQAKKTIGAGVVTSFIKEGSIRRRLVPGSHLVFEVRALGSPSDMIGVGAKFITALDGGSGGGQQAVISSAANLEDGALKQAMEALETQINTVKSATRTYAAQLRSPNSSSSSTTTLVYVSGDENNQVIDSSQQSVTSTTYADVTSMTATFSSLDTSKVYEMRVTHSLEGFGNGGNAFGDIEIDTGSVTPTTEHQNNAAVFMHNGIRNSTTGRAIIRFTGSASITIKQRVRKVTYSGATTNFLVDASSWTAELYREDS